MISGAASGGASLVANKGITSPAQLKGRKLATASLRFSFGPHNTMDEVDDVLERLRAPFNISTAAQAAGKAAMEDAEHVAASRDHNAIWLPWMTERFREAGLHVQPSVANFVLVRFPDDPARNAQAAFEFFGSRGIIARETGGYGLPGWLRFTIGREDEMRAVADAACDFMAGACG